MRRLLSVALLTALTLGISPLFAADAIVSDAPPLPDFSGNSVLPGDMSMPGLDLPAPPPPAAPTGSAATAAPALAASPTLVPQTVTTTGAPVATVPVTSTTAVGLPTPITASAVATPTVVAFVATPTTVAVTAIPTEVPTAAPALASAAPAASVAALEGLEAYFPMRTGAKWNYVSKSGQTRVITCLSRDAQGKSVGGTFLVTVVAAPATQIWKLTGGKVVLGANTSSLRAGYVRLVTPQGATIPRWVYDRLDGTASYFKQEVGPVEVGGKQYADGLTVTERTLKGATQVSLHKWFYAKGTGLVMDAAYGPTGAALPNQTFELQSAQ